MDGKELANGLIYYVVFLLSTTLHEAAHAWVAMRGGDLTAYSGGQVSLNPWPHIRREPFGMVILPLIGISVSGWPIGFASTPYNLNWARAYPKRAGLMALAGPAANFLLVIVAGVALRTALGAGVVAIPDLIGFEHVATAQSGTTWGAFAALTSVFFSMNLLLCVFNLLPLPPLDGSGIVPLFLNDRLTSTYQNFLYGNPMFGMIGMIVAWKVVGQLFWPVFSIAVQLLYIGVGSA